MHNHTSSINLYTTIKITSEFKNVLVTVGVVDGLTLHGKQIGISAARLMASTGEF